jgi:hypothetical protein
MRVEDFKIKDRVLVGDKSRGQEEREMVVYEETSSNGEKYLALRTDNGREYNGKLELYLKGFWGGIKKKL